MLQVGGVSLATSDATYFSDFNLYSWTSPGITWAAANIGHKFPVSLRVADDTAPSVESAEVTATKPKELVIDFNEALDTGSVPAASQFTVKIGGSTTGAPSVSSVAIDADKVKLGLGVALDAGQTSVTVDYTKPASNPLRDAAQNEVATFTNRAVTNNAPACPGGQPAHAFWTACLTVGEIKVGNITAGRGFAALGSVGSLSLAAFSVSGTAYTVDLVSDDGSNLNLSFAADPRPASESWILQVGSRSFRLDARDRYSTSRHTYSWTSPGFTWLPSNVGDKVSVSLRKPGVGLTFSPTAVDVDEGDMADYTVKLAAQPSASVTVDIATDDAGAATVAPTSLTFTTMNWNTARTVTVTGVGDNDADDETVTLTHSGNGVETDTVAVSVDDDEIGLVFSSTDVTVDEGDTADYTVALAEQPDASVIVGIASLDPDAASPAPSVLTFTAMNWDQAQTVMVTGVQDSDDDHETVTLTHIGTVVGRATVEVAVRDDEAASSMFIFSQTEFEIRQGGTAKYTIRLREQPSSGGSVHIWTLKSSLCQGAGRERCDPRHNPVSMKPPFVKFDRTNWDVPQEVTLRATGATDSKDELGVVLRHVWWIDGKRGEDRTVRIDIPGTADACPHGLWSGTFWTACLTVGSSGGKVGYSSGGGSLSDTTFVYGGTTYTIEGLYLENGRMHLDLDGDAGSGSGGRVCRAPGTRVPRTTGVSRSRSGSPGARRRRAGWTRYSGARPWRALRPTTGTAVTGSVRRAGSMPSSATDCLRSAGASPARRTSASGSPRAPASGAWAGGSRRRARAPRASRRASTRRGASLPTATTPSTG